ncbi:MAG: hypothetical protein N3A72_06800 [bacterium]|nr:hypothetical protein [bacterium]
MQDVLGYIRTEVAEVNLPTESDWQKFHTTLTARLTQKPKPNYLHQCILWLKTMVVSQPSWVTAFVCAVTITILVFHLGKSNKSFASNSDSNQFRFFRKANR